MILPDLEKFKNEIPVPAHVIEYVDQGIIDGE
jgi:hypothetical protein